MNRVRRREFLKTSSGLTAAAALGVSALGARRVLGANETLRVAVAGVRGRGGSHIGAFSGNHGCEVVALVDPDEREIARRRKQLDKANKAPVAGYPDIRKCLEDILENEDKSRYVL